jgi:hypothetical protein
VPLVVIGLFAFDEADVFSYAHLMPIREACRQIIAKILREAAVVSIEAE